MNGDARATDDQMQSLRLHERLLFERIRAMQSERATVLKRLRRAIRESKRTVGANQ